MSEGSAFIVRDIPSRLADTPDRPRIEEQRGLAWKIGHQLRIPRRLGRLASPTATPLSGWAP